MKLTLTVEGVRVEMTEKEMLKRKDVLEAQAKSFPVVDPKMWTPEQREQGKKLRRELGEIYRAMANLHILRDQAKRAKVPMPKTMSTPLPKRSAQPDYIKGPNGPGPKARRLGQIQRGMIKVSE